VTDPVQSAARAARLAAALRDNLARRKARDRAAVVDRVAESAVPATDAADGA